MAKKKAAEEPTVGLFVETCAKCGQTDDAPKQPVMTDGEVTIYHRSCLPEEYWLETAGFFGFATDDSED